MHYLTPIPAAAIMDVMLDFSLEDMVGFGDTSNEAINTHGSSFVTEEHNLTVSSSAVQLKFVFRFQFGFDGGLQQDQ